MKNLQSVRGQPLLDTGPVGVLQGKMYGLRKVLTGFKGPGKDLLERCYQILDQYSFSRG